MITSELVAAQIARLTQRVSDLEKHIERKRINVANLGKALREEENSLQQAIGATSEAKAILAELTTVPVKTEESKPQ